MENIQSWYANKIIAVVRNPIDTCLSWLNIVSMNNHNTKCPFDYDKSYPKWFNWWVQDCCTLIKDWTG